jgi:AraC-like DNA-binding protein
VSTVQLAAATTMSLRRDVLQYVDDHLITKITRQDLAKVAGLSRMHFAAQFRAAVGMRPHQYLLKRRIERAEALLKQAEISLVRARRSAHLALVGSAHSYMERFH